MSIELKQLPQIITAIGGLGTAAFGVVEATKAFGGGVNRYGFMAIKKTITTLTPGASVNALSQSKIVATLKANWYNGTDLSSQKAIAKSLIKLNLSTGNAAALAAETAVDPAVLTSVAGKIAAGTPLTSTESDVYARFDLIVTALLDERYQHSDNIFRNWTRAWAALVAIALAVLGGWALNGKVCFDQNLGQSVLVGILATPLAPIAKDLSTALATAVNTLQLVKK